MKWVIVGAFIALGSFYEIVRYVHALNDVSYFAYAGITVVGALFGWGIDWISRQASSEERA